MTVQSDQDLTEAQSQDQGSQDPTQGQPVQEKITVAGKEYSSLGELAKDYESLNKQFHKKSQPEDTEVLQAKEALKSLGVATLEDLQELQRKQADESKLQGIVMMNPDLGDKVEEIKDLMNLPKNQGKAIEDVIAQYGLKPSDKLIKAKSVGDFVGKPLSLEKKDKRVSDLSQEEKDKYIDNLLSNPANKFVRA